ncbi:carboxypeptidase-like regulatory domain-containing protein [Pontibacter sp. MBLB2868]|uniref:carboxypeptidase-like regulatory domain-containing protein n=1 Tax=Pontibacter sp. MBLB2868 TaxID=3451555 RepID=UPI003F750DF3
MFRTILLLLLILGSITVNAQSILRGKVIDNQTNEPLEFVSIYLNNTTTGTHTNEKGEFTLGVGVGTYEVVVSFIGYEPVIYQVKADSLAPSYLIKLAPKAFNLGEVEITAKRDKEWYYNLEVFKQNFLGRSKLGQQCKILNPEVLIIVYDSQEGVLDVQAKDVLLIDNKALGYRIEYLLTDFKLYFRENYCYFLGYPKFIQMQGGNNKLQRWSKNREKAYSGSFMHFVRALQKKQLAEQGFNLRRLYRIPNPNRPTDEEIAQARAAIRLSGTSNAPDNENESILSRARLPKLIQSLDINPVPYEAYLTTEAATATLAFADFMQVVYTGEKEELAYLLQFSDRKSGKPSYQTSVISLHSGSVQLEPNGSVSEPLDVLLEGYWGWEKVGEMLPLDYKFQ